VPSLPDEVVANTREKYVEAFPSSHRPGAAVISDRLEGSSKEMVDKGVQFDDAVHEFESASSPACSVNAPAA